MYINQNEQLIFFGRQLFFAFVFFLFSGRMIAQQNTVHPVSSKELHTIIDSIDVLVKRYYIHPEVGKQMVQHIRSKDNNGSYQKITNPKALADTLKTDLRSINGDLHMGMIYRSPRERATAGQPSIQVNESGLWSNYGLSEIKVLEGNIGYLKISHFTRHEFFEAIKPVVTSAIESLKNTDAIIVDVRDNGGGFEDMVAYYISYFFDSAEPIHLSDYRCTLHDHTYGISTNPNVLGTKLPDTKLFVLVNSNTGSAAESFAYMLKHLGRATIIGEVTVGAGNGASLHPINDRFTLVVSTEETINAVTKTSFEKVGVIPHIKTSSEEAYAKGYRLALEHAKEKNATSIHPSNYDHLISFIDVPRENDPLSATDLQKYVGVYKDGNTEITITLENNLLFGQMRSNGGKMKLKSIGNHIFKVGNIKERVQFVLDSKGNVTQLKGLDNPMKLTKISEK